MKRSMQDAGLKKRSLGCSVFMRRVGLESVVLDEAFHAGRRPGKLDEAFRAGRRSGERGAG